MDEISYTKLSDLKSRMKKAAIKHTRDKAKKAPSVRSVLEAMIQDYRSSTGVHPSTHDDGLVDAWICSVVAGDTEAPGYAEGLYTEQDMRDRMPKLSGGNSVMRIGLGDV